MSDTSSESYQFMNPSPPAPEGSPPSTVKRASDGAFIPMHDLNTDCARFLMDWKAGASVTDASGQDVEYSDEAVIALGLTPPANGS